MATPHRWLSKAVPLLLILAADPAHFPLSSYLRVARKD
jgi:hypothetical protein